MSGKFQKRVFKDPQSKLTSEDIDNCVDIPTAKEYLIALGGNILDADMQIGNAKGKAASDGEYMDTKKYQNLLSYRKVLGFLHQKTIFRIRELNDATSSVEHPTRTLGNIFMDLARKELPAEEFNNILSKALQIKEGKTTEP